MDGSWRFTGGLKLSNFNSYFDNKCEWNARTKSKVDASDTG